MSLISRWLVCLGAVLLFSRVVLAAPLPALGADLRGTSVSGLSSGGFMAVQYQVAFSASVQGAGVVAGGPYYCAGAWGKDAAVVSLCMGKIPTMGPDTGLLQTAARRFAEAGSIDSLDHLRRARIYVFSGTHDEVVSPRIVDATVRFFRQAGVSVAAVKYEKWVAAGHAFITPDYGNSCPTTAAPYINHCMVHGKGYDQAGNLLKHIYGRLAGPATTLSAQVTEFEQRDFASVESGLADTAYVYIPEVCRTRTGCRIHVVFHGCLQSAGQIGDLFYARTGYNRWADTNRIIVLYPQVAKDTQPNSCWDWIGYTGENYATRGGPQMQAVQRMVQRLQMNP